MLPLQEIYINSVFCRKFKQLYRNFLIKKGRVTFSIDLKSFCKSEVEQLQLKP